MLGNSSSDLSDSYSSQGSRSSSSYKTKARNLPPLVIETRETPLPMEPQFNLDFNPYYHSRQDSTYLHPSGAQSAIEPRQNFFESSKEPMSAYPPTSYPAYHAFAGPIRNERYRLPNPGLNPYIQRSFKRHVASRPRVVQRPLVRPVVPQYPIEPKVEPKVQVKKESTFEEDIQSLPIEKIKRTYKDKRTCDFHVFLMSYNASKGNPRPVHMPVLNRSNLDMLALFDVVTSFGGPDAVSKSRKWSQVASALGVPKKLTSAAHTLRGCYAQYLADYEKEYLQKGAHFFTDDKDVQDVREQLASVSLDHVEALESLLILSNTDSCKLGLNDKESPMDMMHLCRTTSDLFNDEAVLFE